MNDFMDMLDADMLANHFSVAEFGEMVEYLPASGGPSVQIQALFDAPFSDAGTVATEDVVDNRPHLTCRSIDIENGEVSSGDRFVIRGKTYRPVGHESNQMGVIRCWLHEVTT